MGLAASSGNDNDDLIDKLIDANIVVTHRVETALRLVDRRRFFPVEGRYIAYKDLAWKSDFGSPGRIHISAPCIYGNVLECLNLQEGNSFLNVGSGTGYLSTVAGYLLGSNGVNHGIEIHPNIVEYARSLVAETLHCPETQCYDWAIPEFACGNGLHLSPSHYNKYDRVYCGAAVPTSHRRILWELLKIDGILVMPYDDQLLQVRRQAVNVFEVKIITSVSFSDFILPTEEERSKELYSDAPPFKSISTLQFLCALSIRKIIRSAVAVNHKIHIRNFVSQQPQRIRENHVVVEFRDGEQPVAQQAHFENRQPRFREILAIVGADFVAENENNNEVEEAEPEQRRLARERFRMVWFRHHLRAHIANRVVRRRHLLEMEAQEAENAETGDGQNSDVEIINGNNNSEYNSSSLANSDPVDASLDATESNSDCTSMTGRSKKRSHIEHEGESSLSAKRRNDDDDDDNDDDDGHTDKEWKNDVVCEVQDIPKQDLAGKSSSNSGSAATAQEKLMELEENANYKNEKNVPKYSEEAKNPNDLKFVEKVAENKESVDRWAEEMVEQMQDLSRKEADTSEDIIMENVSRHQEKSVHLDQSRNYRQNLTKVQSGTTLDSSSFDSNHLEEYSQESSKSSNESIQIQNSKIHKEANDKKRINNLISNNKLCRKSDGMQNVVEVNSENFTSKNHRDLKNDKIMWQNNRLYKNRVEDNSTERYDSNNRNGTMVNIGNSSTNNGHLVVSAREGENSSHNEDGTDDYNDDSDEDASYDNDNDNSDEDDSDEDEDGDGNDDDDVSSSSSDTEHRANQPERDNYLISSRNKNKLYRAARHTAQSMSAAVDGQGSNHDFINSVESDSNDNALEDESISRRRSDVGDELQTEEAQKREKERLEERGRQLNDIRMFATVFERRIMELPLNRALKEYIICLC